MILAAHSNCHPVIENGQQVAADSSDCQTSHLIDASGLANTGKPVWLPAAIGGGAIILAGGLVVYRRQLAKQTIRRK